MLYKIVMPSTYALDWKTYASEVEINIKTVYKSFEGPEVLAPS